MLFEQNDIRKKYTFDCFGLKLESERLKIGFLMCIKHKLIVMFFQESRMLKFCNVIYKKKSCIFGNRFFFF